MLRRTRKHRKKLAKLILAALLCSGGVYGLMSPSVAEAAGSVTVTGYTNSGGFAPSGSMTRVSTGSGYYNAYPADESVTVLNIAPGVEDAWEDGASKVSVWGHSGTEASGYTVTMAGDKARLYMLSGGIYKAEGYGSYLGTANENTVSVSDKAAVDTSVYGGYIYAYSRQGSVSSAQGTADKNTVTISGDATVGESVYGGDVYAYSFAYAAEGTTTAEGSGTADANNNTVTISGNASVGKNVYGGSGHNSGGAYVYSYTYTATYDLTSNANNNTVTISDNTSVGKAVYGGYAYAYDSVYYYGVVTSTASGSAANNTVIISDNASVGSAVYGGYAYAYAYYGVATADATADKNTVTISGATVKGDVVGGSASASAYTYVYDATDTLRPSKATASANENTVTIDGAAVSGTVTGGSASASAYAYYGGEITVEGSADNNTVTISGDTTVDNNIIGGSSTGSADNNTVTLSGKTVVNAILDQYGYYTTANIIGGNSTGEGDNNSGSADNNTVTISGDTVVGESSSAYGFVYIYGGHSKNGSRSVSGNTVTISDNVVVGRVSSSSENAYVSAYIYGGYGESSSGNADNNTVAISDNVAVADGSYSNAYVYGGRTYYGSANKNKVTISGDTVVVGKGSASITGGYGAIADENTVTIGGKAFVGSERSANITGGYSTAYDSDELTANNNTVTITDDAVVGYGSIYGGFAYYGEVISNTVTISGNAVVGGTSEERIYGGLSGYGITGNNTITISDNAVVGSESSVYIYGGLTYYAESADNNTVTISDNAAVNSGTNVQIYGGLTYSGESADNNKITVSDNAVVAISENETGSSIVGGTKMSIFGGYSQSGSADKNEITFSGDKVTVGSDAYRLYIYGGYSKNENSTTNENKVTISGKADVGSNASYVSVYGGGGIIETFYYYFTSYDYSTAAADNNTVTISDNAAVGSNASYVSVYGGQSYSNSSNENTVTISDNAVVGNAYAYVYGGFAGGDSSSGSASTVSSRTADNNTVTISDNAVVGGGYGASIYGGESYSSSANNNTVTISDSAVVGSEYAYIMGAYGSSTANDNTVTISGNAAVAAGSETHASSVSILGAYASAYGIEEGGASNNAVTIRDDAAVGSYAYSVSINGAESYYGIVSNNTVTISDDAVVATHSGTDSYYSMQIMGGQSYYGIAENNTVTISGGTVGDADNYKNSRITGGSSYVEATGNTVTIEGDTTTVYAGAVVGGYSQYTENTSANTTDNIVTINAKEVEIGLVYGGRTDKGNASKNTVTITNGSVTGKVSSSGYYYGTAAVAGGYVVKNGDATSNTVELNGVTVSVPENDGSGGSPTSLLSSSASSPVSITLGVVGGYAGGGDATNNTVKLQDTIISGGVYGGANNPPVSTIGDSDSSITGSGEGSGGESAGSSGDVVTGNTLIISGINTVDGEVTNFETIKLADTVEWNTKEPVLKASQFTINGDEDGTRASLDITDAESNLAAGTSGRMTLLASETKNDFATLTLKSTEGADNLSETNPYKVLSATSETSSKADGVAVKFQGEHKVSLDAEDNYKNVLYTVENKAKEISLETMTWNTGRDLAGAYAFDGTIPVDATNLAFKSITTALKVNDSMTLVSNATGLTSANTVKNGTGKTAGIGYTDKGSGIKYAATASGNVTAGTGVVTYTVDSVTADKITLASRAWGAAADEMPETWKASASTQIDAAKFTYTGEATTALKKNDTAAILTASGLTTASPVTDGADKTVAVNYTDAAGINFAATAQGHVEAAKNAVNYVVDAVEVNSVNLAKWNGTDTSAVTEGWTGSGVAVTGSFTAPTDLAAGSARDIVTATGGFFTDDNIDEAIRYGQGDAFRETENNVTVEGHKVGGVKAEDEGAKLAYYAMEKSAETMTFGEIAFAKDDIARDLKNAYVFDSSSVIDATDLTFTETTEALNKDDSMTLAANATGITEKNDVTQPADPAVPIAYTDSAGIKFGAAASGTVKAAADTVNYVVDSVAVNSIDLAGWSGTASAVTEGWTLADGATVETDGMTAPAVDPGKHVDIMTSGTDGYFDGATINGENKYQAASFDETEKRITFKGTQEKGVKADGKNLVYVAGGKLVDTATMTGTIAWKDGGTYYKNTKYDFTADSEIDMSGVKFTTDADPLNQSMTLISNADGTVKDGTPEFTVKLSNTVLETTAAGEAAIASKNLQYTVTNVTLDKVTVNEAGDDAVPKGWAVNSGGVTVDTDNMTAPEVAAGEEKPILSGGAADTFSDDKISGANKYKETAFTDASNPDDTSKGVSITGAQGKGVKASEDGTGLVYKVSRKEVSAVNAGATGWQPGATLLDGSNADYDYSKVSEIGTDSFDVTFDKPEEVAAGESMTLLKANETLADMAAQEKTSEYSFEPVSGVTVDAGITASLEVKDGIVTYTPSENKAGKLTFGDVLWNADAPMLTRPDNITFAGADVDTSAINFTNVIYLDANQQMTLVSGFGDSVGTITGGKYMVGTAFIGEGEASLSGSDLIFTTTTEAGLSEQTHKTVMAMDAGLAMLLTGNEFMGKAMDGLADVKNRGKDGVSTFAAVGGGSSRYDTGSHVNTHTWNAIVGVGKTTETKKGTVEYGIFGEYGKGSYKVYSNAGNGDGDAHYAGGGLLAKFTNKQNVYTEASVRAGRLSDSSSDIMQDSLGNKYGYNVHANYFGAHIGAGRVIDYKGGKSLDVYGKFFYLKRDGVEYDAVQHYSLDSVSSSILRLGARYGTKDRKWNWYGGLAYEYEFDGESTGTVKGKAIRAASIQGSSVRGEFGMRMDATKTNPWSTDISLYGYAGKHRGFGGNVSVTYTF